MHILVQVTMASLTVTTSPDTTVSLGGSTALRCQYTGVTNSSSLVVRWEHRARGQPSGPAIWMYDGKNDWDTWHGDQNTFEKIDTDIVREHSIKLRKANLADEGLYFCNVEYYNDEGYLEKNANLTVTIIGMQSIIDSF